MKAGWEIKKLGEVCKLYQPKTISVEMLVEDGEYLVYGANGIIGHYNQYNHEDSEVLLTCRGATCGSINISEPYSWINGNAMVVKPLDKNNIKQQFLKYYLISVDWNDIITGAAQPQITRLSLSPLPIPIPPLSEQEQIVAELDLISGIIEKKKQQLKELDSLAQSIFYEMFGNPVENEKGWEVKKLGEVCDVRDGTHDSPKYLENSDYVLITSKNIVNGTIDFTSVSYISEEDFVNINKRSGVDDGDIIMAMIGTIGKPVIVKDINRNFCIKNVALIKFVNESLVTNTYIRALLDNVSYCQYIQSQNKGGTQKFVALGAIRKFDIPTPPLPLQQEFASKIEKIDKQKELIKQSLQETETLFNSRMDFYFN